MTGRRWMPPPCPQGRLLLWPGMLVVVGLMMTATATAQLVPLPSPPPPKPSRNPVIPPAFATPDPVVSEPEAADIVPDVPPDLKPAVPSDPGPGDPGPGDPGPGDPTPGDPTPDGDDAVASEQVDGTARPLPAAPLPKPPVPVTTAAADPAADTVGEDGGEAGPDAGTAADEPAAALAVAALPAIPLAKPAPPGSRAGDAGAEAETVRATLSSKDLTTASPTRDPDVAGRAAVADRSAAAAADVDEAVTVPAGPLLPSPPLPSPPLPPPRVRPEPAGQVPELSRLSSGNMLFDRADRNGDLRLSWGEMADARRRRFAEFDRDGDGTIAFQEYSNQSMPIGLRQVPDRLLVLRARRFARYDSDGDGLVSEAEYVDAGQDLFDLMDRNRNGLLTPEEYDLVWRPAAGRVR